MIILTHADDPDIPEGCSIEMPDGGPNPQGVQAVLDSIEKWIINTRVKEAMEAERLMVEGGKLGVE